MSDSGAASTEIAPARSGRQEQLREIVAKYGLLIVYAGLFVFFAIQRTDSFLRVDTWTRTILSPTGFTPLLILAVGLTVVLSMGDFDLSFGNMVGLAGGSAAALMVNHGVNWAVAILVVLLTAVAREQHPEVRTALAVNALAAAGGLTPMQAQAIDASRVFAVSNTQGTGIAELQAYLDDRACQQHAKAAAGNFRMSIDRAFNLKGSGLVVTGTAIAGSVEVGDYLTVSPRAINPAIPAEVEAVLERHDAIREALVVGEPHAVRGETIIAYVTAAEGEVGVDDVVDHCRNLLPRYKIPASIHIVDRLPLNAMGKRLRAKLR